MIPMKRICGTCWIGTAASIVFLSGYLSIWLLLAGSRSTDPAVLGRYSPGLAAFLAISALPLAALAAGLLLARSRTAGRMHGALETLGKSILPEILLFAGLPLLQIFRWLGPQYTPLAQEGQIILGAAAMLAGGAAAMLAAGSSGRMMLFLKRSFLAAFTVILLAVALEAGLRIVSPGSVFHASLDMRPNVRVRLESDLPGVQSGGTYSTNSWGMRGEEPPDDWDAWTTIVCVGGSTTQCFELDDTRTWPWLLQQHLRSIRPETWVGNGGLAGHGTRMHILFVREVVDEVRPDVALFLVGVNDMVNYLGMEPGRQAALVSSEPDFEWWLFCNSRLAQVAYFLKKAWIDEVPVQGTPWARAYEPEPLPGLEMDLPDDLHDLMHDRDFTLDKVRTLIRMSREIGVEPVFLTHPLLFDDTDYWRGIFGTYCWKTESPDSILSAATYWRMLDTINDDVIRACREEGASCYDLASAVPHSPEYFYDGVHFSEAGASLVADSVAAFMVREGILDRLPGNDP